MTMAPARMKRTIRSALSRVTRRRTHLKRAIAPNATMGGGEDVRGHGKIPGEAARTAHTGRCEPGRKI